MTTMTSPSLKAVSESPPLIQTRDLTKRYGSNVLALDALTVSIDEGSPAWSARTAPARAR